MTQRGASARRVLSTTKSEVVVHEECVVKRYRTADSRDRIAQDQESLTRLCEEVPPLVIGRWRACTVRPLWVALDGHSFGMERVRGSLLAELDSATLRQAEFLYGAWVAHFHQHMHGDQARGPLFTDVSLHNAILDDTTCRLVILDPGKQFGRNGSIYEDVVQHILTVGVMCLKRFSSPFPYVREFLAGYRTGNRTFSFGEYARGLARAHLHAAVGLARTRPVRLPVLVMTALALMPLYVAYVPAVLMGRAPLGGDSEAA